MAVRFTSSFDNNQDSDASGIFSAINQSFGSGGSAAVSFNAAYTRWPTGKGLRLATSTTSNSTSSYITMAFNAQSTWIIGAAIRPSATVTGNGSYGNEIFAFKSGANLVFELRFNGSAYYVTRNGTTIATGAAVSTTQFAYVEFKVVIHPSAGSYLVRVNGTTYLSGSGLNTSGTGGTTADTLEMGANVNGPQFGTTTVDVYYDDMYIADGTGSGVNDVIGDCHPMHYLPNANGTFSDWAQTGGTGGSPFTAVNDTPNNGDTSYLAGSGSGQRTTLRYPALTAGTVKAVVVAPWLRKDDSNTFTVAARTYEGGTEQNGSQTFQPATTYAAAQLVMETDPKDGTAWTIAKVNASEFGLVVS